MEEELKRVEDIFFIAMKLIAVYHVWFFKRYEWSCRVRVALV